VDSDDVERAETSRKLTDGDPKTAVGECTGDAILLLATGEETCVSPKRPGGPERGEEGLVANVSPKAASPRVGQELRGAVAVSNDRDTGSARSPLMALPAGGRLGGGMAGAEPIPTVGRVTKTDGGNDGGEEGGALGGKLGAARGGATGGAVVQNKACAGASCLNAS
jgi:hypothetical protein